MTVQGMLDELRASLGNRTDLATQDQRLVDWLNWSQYELAGVHQKRILSPKRFHVLEGETFLSTTIVTGTCSNAGTASSIVLHVGASGTDDYYNGQLIEITGYTGTAPDGLIGQKKVITDYTGGTLTGIVSSPWDVIPDANTQFTLYKRMYSIATDLGISPANLLWIIERVENVEDGTPIEQKSWLELIGTSWTETGEPSAFARRDDMLMFDTTPDDTYTYKVFFYKFPALLTTVNMPTTSSVYPDYWHELIVQGAVYRGFEKLMEPNRADEAKQKFLTMAVNRRDEFELESQHIQRRVKLRVR